MMSDHLILKGSTWHVRLDVPADVRNHPKFYDKKSLTKSTKTGNKQLAKDISHEIIGIWKKEIQLARSSRANETWKLEASDAETKFRTLLEEAESDEQLQTALDYRMGIQGWIRYQNALNDAQAEELSEIISGKPTRDLITDSQIRKFEAYQSKTLVMAKTAASQASNIRQIRDYLKQTNKPLNYDSIAEFLGSLELSTATKKMKLASGNSYWQYLLDVSPNVKKLTNPFINHRFKKIKKGSLTISYEAFEVAEVESLYNAALAKKDMPLAQTIKIAAYTGCRIEEICQIQAHDIFKGYFKIGKAKTASGVREVPIHSKLQSLFDELSASTTDGYLIHTDAKNQFMKRSGPISKRFGRLKLQLEFNDRQVFHSIRKTVTTQLHQAGAEPLTMAAILGHKTNTMTFDIYSKGPSMTQKAEAIKKLNYIF